MVADRKSFERWLEVTVVGPVIHLGRGDGLDNTLCGVALEGVDGDEEMDRTRRIVTCPQCIGLIHYCKSVPARILQKVKHG